MDIASQGVPELEGSPHPAEEKQYGHSFSGLVLDHPFTIGFSDDISISGFLDLPSPAAPRDCLKVDSSGSSDRQSSSRNQDCALALPDPHNEVNIDRLRKRKDRTVERHNLSEKKRRDKIEAKMKLLRELIPNSQKLDKASLLDKAMSHIKTLQRQLKIMQGMNPYPYLFAPPTPLYCSGTNQLSPFGPPTPPNNGVITGLNMDISTIQPQLTLGIPYNPPLWSPVAGNFMSMPPLPPNPYFQPPFYSAFMEPQTPSMSEQEIVRLFQLTDGTLKDNEMFS